MWVKLTEQAAEILLDEGEVQTLVEGKEVIGSPIIYVSFRREDYHSATRRNRRD